MQEGCEDEQIFHNDMIKAIQYDFWAFTFPERELIPMRS